MFGGTTLYNEQLPNGQMASNQLREMVNKNIETLQVYINRNGAGMVAHTSNPSTWDAEAVAGSVVNQLQASPAKE